MQFAGSVLLCEMRFRISLRHHMTSRSSRRSGFNDQRSSSAAKMKACAVLSNGNEDT
jgi:hypothetical protein